MVSSRKTSFLLPYSILFFDENNISAHESLCEMVVIFQRYFSHESAWLKESTIPTRNVIISKFHLSGDREILLCEC